MPLLHVVDGTYELFRAHFGAPPRKAPNGQEVGATLGLFQSMASLLRQPEVTHVAVATDHVIESFRNQLFEGYKTGEGIAEELALQFPLAERALQALGLRVWPMVEFEADDALASAAARFGDKAERVLIMTPDKDLAQCVLGERVVMVDRRRKLEIDETGVVAKWGVSPASIPDYLALVGDDADGIPGLPGWGAKSSASVLARYGHLEDVPSAAGDWDVKVRGAAKLADTLAARREDALLYRTLATLRDDAPIDEDLDALRWRGPDVDALRVLGEELGQPELAARAPKAH